MHNIPASYSSSSLHLFLLLLLLLLLLIIIIKLGIAEPVLSVNLLESRGSGFPMFQPSNFLCET